MSADASRIPPADTELRADARHNRSRIVDVAKELFAEHGLEVPMTTIARQADVGIATLYRRFPTKEALVAEVFAEQFAACVSSAHEALNDPDPWHGFCTLIENVCAMQAVDRGFSAAVITSFPTAFDIKGERDRVMRGFVDLMARAKASGRLRADFSTDDLALLLMANGGIIADSPETALAASRRLVAYLLDAFRADRSAPATPLPPSPPLELHPVLDPEPEPGNDA